MKTNLRPAYFYSGNLLQVIKDPARTKDEILDIHYQIEHYISEYEKAKKEIDGMSVAASFQDAIQTVIDENKDSEYGKKVKCAKGCSFCCNLHVDISDDEADLLISYAKEMDIEIDTTRLEKQKDKNLQTWNKLKYADRKCVFLDDKGSCKVYEFRPISCRMHQVVTEPALCDTEKGSKEQVASFSILQAEVMTSGASNATRSDSMAKLLMEKMDTKKNRTELTETEKLCCKRLRAKGVPFSDIADRLGIKEEDLKIYLKILYKKKS